MYYSRPNQVLVGEALEAAANDQLEEIVRVPAKIRLELPNEISRASVQPVIDQLNAAQPGSSFELHLRHNGGGCVATMIDLIVALNETKGTVEITFGSLCHERSRHDLAMVLGESYGQRSISASAQAWCGHVPPAEENPATRIPLLCGRG
ncbi:hypothetical protein [Pseudomonas putida]|uniref:hypothetical protein n=1 Tax=Pseudomonas putida TaxID=303 RepID=UPI00373635CF